MRGKIERIWENQTKDGERYWVLSIDGKNYSVWDPAVLEGLSEGMEVEYEFRRSGKYNRITDLKKLDTSQQGPDAESPRDLKIIRMSCLRSAVEVLSGYGSELEERIEKTLEVSRRFERYVLNGE